MLVIMYLVYISKMILCEISKFDRFSNYYKTNKTFNVRQQNLE